MQRPRSHQIDELAQRVFRDSLPPTWVVNEQFKDYGKDYLVEIADHDGNLLGISFYVQLKGKECIDDTASTGIAYSLEARHVEYYFEKVRDLPLILVLVDVSRKVAWWLFLQKTLERIHTSSSQKYHTIHVPASNIIHNSNELLAEVNDAARWMRRNYPDLRTPFLQQCFDYLCVEQGLSEAEIIDDGMIEGLSALYGVRNSSGMPLWDDSGKNWEFICEQGDLVRLNVFNDGRCEFLTADDHYEILSVHLRNPEELGDIFTFVDSFSEHPIDTSPAHTVAWSQALKSVDIVVPVHDTHRLVSFQTLVQAQPRAGKVIRALLDGSSNAWDRLMNMNFTGWEPWCLKNVGRSGSINFRRPNSAVLVYSANTGVVTYRRWVAFRRSYRHDHVAIALTYDPGVASPMWLCDTLNQLPDLNATISKIVSFKGSWAGVSACFMGDLPNSKVKQSKERIEARMAQRSN